jgi:hypothetical protein
VRSRACCRAAPLNGPSVRAPSFDHHPGFSASNVTVFNAPHVSYSLGGFARESSIVIESGLVGQAVIDVYVSGGLTQDDVTSSYDGCAFNSSGAEGALTYVCSNLQIGNTEITFSANKDGGCGAHVGAGLQLALADAARGMLALVQSRSFVQQQLASCGGQPELEKYDSVHLLP